MSKFKFYQQLKAEEKELLETLHALQILIKRYETENQDAVKLGNAIENEFVAVNPSNEDEFDANGTVAKKLLQVLKMLKNATSREVAEKAYQLDHSRTQEQWLDDSRFYLSKYYNENKLIVIKDGSNKRGNVYGFPNV